MEMVDKHNKEAEEGLHSYTLGENEFSDLTFLEFLDTMTGYNESLDFDILSDPALEGKFPEDTFGFPQSWDCRDHGLVSTVRSQGSCGSCWAFAAVGAVEGAWAKEKGQLYRLSEQELIDCDKSDGGCSGGGISSALTWVHNHHGLAKNADYGVGHYHPSQGNCHLFCPDLGSQPPWTCKERRLWGWPLPPKRGQLSSQGGGDGGESHKSSSCGVKKRS